MYDHRAMAFSTHTLRRSDKGSESNTHRIPTMGTGNTDKSTQLITVRRHLVATAKTGQRPHSLTVSMHILENKAPFLECTPQSLSLSSAWGD